MEKMDEFLLFVFICITVMSSGLCNQYRGIIREYCMETFQPRCPSNEVIFMKHAMYGRMKVGSCVKNNPNAKECSANELAEFDEKCSGRHECEIIIPNRDLAAKQPCLKGLMSYLEASYTCQKVYKPRQGRCISPETMTAKKKVQYIGSVISKGTSCGLHESPWVIEAQKGQNINLSLINFSWGSSLENLDRCAVKYGYILDLQNDDVINICGGRERKSHLYQSKGHSVQIVLEASVIRNKHFLIQHQALGCPEYSPPKYSLVKHDNGSLVVQCEHSEQTWKLRCVDNIWFGMVGDCTPPPPKKIDPLPKLDVKIASVKAVDTSANLPSVSDNHVVAFALGCVTLIVCCAVVFLGVYFTKRYEVNTLEQINKQHTQKLRFPDGTIRTTRGTLTYKPIRDRATLPEGTVELPPYAFPLPPEQRAPKLPNRGSSLHDPMIASTHSDYLTPQGGGGDNGDDVVYYVLENPVDNIGNMSEEMYHSIKLNNSLSSNKD